MAEISFDEQVAIVTGAGQGLGRSYAVELARRGARVIVNDLVREHADAVVDEITAAGGRAVASYASVSDPNGGESILETALARFGTVDVLINNAGFLRPGYFEDLTSAEIEAVLTVHLGAAFSVTQPVYRVMKAKRYGRIIMTSSSSGLFSHQGLANYAAAKAGLYGLTKALSFEGRESDIHVNALLPYAATTISAANPIPEMEERTRAVGWDRIAPRRLALAVSPLAIYLCARECSITGEAYSACAGRYARVFVGVSPGWIAPDVRNVTAEDIAENLERIRDLEGYAVPASLFEEVALVESAISQYL